MFIIIKFIYFIAVTNKFGKKYKFKKLYYNL